MNDQKTSYATLLVRILSALCFIVVIAATLHRGIPQDQLSIVIYLVSPIVIGTILLGLSFLPPQKIQIVISVLLPALAGAYVAEIYFHSFDSSPKGFPKNERNTHPIQHVLDLRGQGIDAYPMPGFRGFPASNNMGTPKTATIWQNNELIAALPSGLIPLGAIANKAFVYCNEEGNFERFIADEHGFNNPPSLWDKNNLDIALIGDSFTMGVCVPADKHFSAMIRHIFPLTVNLGRLNSGPLFQLATIKEYLPHLRPKTILWFFLEDNDIHGDMRDELKSGVLRKYIEEENFAQNLINQQTIIDDEYMQMLNKAIDEWQKGNKSNNALSPVANPDFNFKNVLSVLKLTHVRGILGLGSDPAFVAETKMLLQTYEKILRQGQAIADSWGGKIVLVYLPSYQRFSSIRGKLSLEKHRKEITTIADNVGIPVIDVTSAFNGHPSPVSLFQGHYTREGYALLGKTLLNQLEK